MKLVTLLIALAAGAFAQNPVMGTAAPSGGNCTSATVGRSYVQTGNPASVNLGVFRCTQSGAATYTWQPISHIAGTTAPATCTVGMVFFDTDASAGSNWFGCTSSDTWTLLSGGGGGGGSTGSGAYASLPATCTTGELYFTTNSYYTVFRCTATNTWTPFLDGQSATLPAACASWTVVNGSMGTATCADTAGATTLSTSSDVNQLEAIVKTVPAAPYTKIFTLSVAAVSPDQNALQCGVGWADGNTSSADFQMLLWQIYSGSATVSPNVARYTDYGWSGGVADAPYQEAILTGRFLYGKLEDNNTNRIFSVSANGVNWLQLYSVTRTSPFTPTHYLVGCGKQSSTTGKPWSVALVSEN